MAKAPKHPGMILQASHLADLGMSSAELARALKVESEHLAKILRGQSAIDADMAIRLGRYFGKDPSYWLNMQQAYDIHKAEMEHDYSGIEKHPSVASFFP
jgi:addiction module HigA family antidote